MLESKWLRVLTHNAVNTHIYIIDTSSSRVFQSILVYKLRYEAVYSSSEFPRGPCSSVGRGRGCALQCGLLVNYGSRAAARLAWAGVGASGSGTGRSGHRPRRWRHEVWDESEHQPGVWSIPRIPSSHGCLPVCVCVDVHETESKGRKCVKGCNVCVHVHKDIYTACVHVLHPGCMDGASKLKIKAALVQKPIPTRGIMISELRVRRTAKSLMKIAATE